MPIDDSHEVSFVRHLQNKKVSFNLIPNSTILGTFSTFSLYLKVEDKLYYFLEIFDCVCGQFYLIYC